MKKNSSYLADWEKTPVLDELDDLRYWVKKDPRTATKILKLTDEILKSPSCDLARDDQSGLGMERLPCGDFGANAMFFRLGTLSYNLFVLFKILALPREWGRHQIQTLR